MRLGRGKSDKDYKRRPVANNTRIRDGLATGHDVGTVTDKDVHGAPDTPVLDECGLSGDGVLGDTSMEGRGPWTDRGLNEENRGE